MKFALGCLSFALVACAGTGKVEGPAARDVDRVQAPPRTVSTVARELVTRGEASTTQRDLLLASLADYATAATLRQRLAGDLRPEELRHVGFEEVSIDQCIEGVTTAILHVREQPGDAQGQQALWTAADLYLRAQREAFVRRRAGAASCLPEMR